MPVLISRYYLIPVLFALLLTAGCTPLGIATGAGAAAGVSAAKEGGIRGTARDLRIQAEINDLWFKYDVKTFSKLDLTINQGRVLITGVVQDPEARVEAVRLAWQPEGVVQVINEIQLAEGNGITGFARDVWITTRLRTELTLDKDVQSINYSIDTVQGSVYLMGVAQDQAELNRVVETARTIPDVKRVVSYVKLVGEPLGQSGTANYNAINSAPATGAGDDLPDYSPDYSQDTYNDTSAGAVAAPQPLTPYER